MQLVMRKMEGEEVGEWFIIEMQGDLESRNKANLEGKYIGDLHYTKEGQPIMIIGHHILYGKIQDMEKPMVAVEKTEVGGELVRKEGEELMEMEEVLASASVEYRVKAVVRKKIVFKTRPKPIIANLPKPNL